MPDSLPRVTPGSPFDASLQPDLTAGAHLILAEGEGAAAVIALFAQADAAFAARATLLYTGSSAMLLPALPSPGAKLFPDVPTLLRAGLECMEQATMGTRIYLSGSAVFLGAAANMAARYGVSFASLRTALRGGVGKRVQCVHCKSIESDVITPTVTCPRCGVKLFVRDHYSHRLNAFMGVSCEAEQPS